MKQSESALILSKARKFGITINPVQELALMLEAMGYTVVSRLGYGSEVLKRRRYGKEGRKKRRGRG